jgi:hypothetical protein
VGASVESTAVRRASIAALLAGLAFVVAGCGEDEPERSPLAESLAQLCDAARADTEALGLPAEKGFRVVRPGAVRGLRLAADIKKLQGTSPAEEEQIASLAEYFRYYHNELRAGAKLYEAGYTDAYALTVERAKGSLASAEALATRMGAPECAVRPFPDR